MNAGAWANPSIMDTNIVNAKPKTAYTPSACMSPDGKTIYFSSNRPGGMGGLDIYKSDLGSDGTWGPATNLGSSINTQYDEDCPFVSYDGSILFFSSKGHNTMGGYDVFMSKGGNGNWGDAQNLGYPINTPDDDNYFVLNPDGRRGYYNTVRLGSMGERDIYQVTFNTPLPVQCVDVLDGYVKNADGSPIPTDVMVTCTANGTAPQVTNANPTTGKFIATLIPNVTYTIVVTTGGKQTNHYVYAPQMDSGYCTLSRAFYNGPVIIGDTTDIFRPKPAHAMLASMFNTDPYFVKFFGYNLDAVTENDPDFSTLVRNIDSGAKKANVVVTIEASASTVPTTKFGSNDKLANARAEALKKALLKHIGNVANVRFELKPAVNGPAFANDAKNVEKYGKFQYVKAFLRQATDKDMTMPSESSSGMAPGSGSSSGAFSIVVGSFSKKENADNLINKFGKKNVQLSVIGQNPKGLYIVGYGKFQSKEEATAEQSAFSKKYNLKGTWVKAN
jgi:cell division septation protein DedD